MQTTTISPAQVIEKCQHGEDLTWAEYCLGASRTLSDPWHGEKYPKHLALAVLNNYITAGRMLDELKKALFYGKNIEDSVTTHANYLLHTLAVDVEIPDTADLSWNTDTTDTQLTHAILGIASESVELVEILCRSLNYNEPLDTVHLVEELGDLFWYIAVIYIVLSPTPNLSPVLRMNLLKLYARYGDKFSAEKAINRDVEAEHLAMQQ